MPIFGGPTVTGVCSRGQICQFLSWKNIIDQQVIGQMAETKGFEPSIRVNPYSYVLLTF